MKKEIEIWLTNQLQECLDGKGNSLQLLCEFKEIRKFIVSFEEAVLEPAIKEFNTYGKGEKVTVLNYKVERSAGGTWKYDNDQNWNDLKTKMELRQEKMKVAKQMSDNLSSLIDDETGEIIPPAIYLANKESLKFTEIKNKKS